MVKPISIPRFDLYAIGTRQSLYRLIGEEISYWSDLDEEVIGLVIKDQHDNDYGWVIMVRDRVGRFRAVKTEFSINSCRVAEAKLRIEISETSRNENLRDLGDQGDEPNTPYDLLSVPEDFDRNKLHPYFKELLESEGREPARAVVKEIGPWLAPSDPHFVKEFQQYNFDQRLWEIFLWASFRELGYDVEQLESPDFKCTAPGISFTVEATTSAPSTMGPLAHHPDPKTKKEMSDFLLNYMPMKYGSSLMSKLNKTNTDGKHYWEREETENQPFVLAIADFHLPATGAEIGSMVYTQSSLWMYLYGRRVEWDFKDGQLVLIPTAIDIHQYKEKKVQSGFFDQPLAENISAVLFSNAGTIAKFDRMGVVSGFAADNHKYFRMGLKYNPDPNAAVGTPFHVDVSGEDYEEYWSDELQVFHNPNAKIPLPDEWFQGVSHHHFQNGDLISYTPDGHVLSSYTMLMKILQDDDPQD